MPKIMAPAVISTGRKRVNPASRAAAIEIIALLQPLARKAYQEDAIRGRNSHAHDSTSESRDGKGRARHEQHPDDASERPGQSRNDDERIEPRLEIDDDNQIDKHNGTGKPEIELGVGAGHCVNLAPHHHMGAARCVFGGLVQDPVDVSGDRAEIASLHGRVDVDDRLDVVVRYDGGARPRGDRGKAPEQLGRLCGGRGNRQIDGIMAQTHQAMKSIT